MSPGLMSIMTNEVTLTLCLNKTDPLFPLGCVVHPLRARGRGVEISRMATRPFFFFCKSLRVNVHFTHADILGLSSSDSYFIIPMPHCCLKPLLSFSPAKLNFKFQEWAMLLCTLALVTLMFPQSETYFVQVSSQV